MSELQPLIERYGPAVLFLNVLLEQLGLPIPAYPALIVAGALAIQGHGISLGEALAVATLACLIADSAWYFAGQRYGGFLLRSICRVSLSRDSCIRQSQSLYLRIGPRALLISKFLPGAGALSTSLAGMTGTAMRRFLGYDLAGSALWAGSALLLGAIFNDAVDHLLGLLHDYASLGALVILGAFVLFLAWRVFRRQRLLRRTARIPRISVSELRRRLDQGNAPRILDVRAELGEDGIPGAISVGLDTPLDSLKDTLGDADVVIYCACPHELSAAMLAERLQAGGYARTWALSGGLDAWHAHQEEALS
ncbi:DedA family protein/thiosulfate sulfurtransferase GlpE [Pseudomonas knackmussii]|uniref:DedA family protein/thiosulfate sulfurtransferase GlpE n=1 Tax=Pseudomonas knackmussii TaxID=65741 RepID=UPI0013633498|nr:DedA family protein/thiosulfate sulfurtransferase GlpE [Pseudomonas knackmussii]